MRYKKLSDERRRELERMAERGLLRRSKRIKAKRQARLLGKCEGENLFLRLPEELLVHVLRRTDSKTLLYASRVNKRWHSSSRVAQPECWERCATAMAKSCGIPRLRSIPLLIEEFKHDRDFGKPYSLRRLPSPVYGLHGSACGSYLVVVLEDSTVMIFSVQPRGSLEETFRQCLQLPIRHLPSNPCFIPSVRRIAYTSAASPPRRGVTRLFLPGPGRAHSPSTGVDLSHVGNDVMDATLYAFEDSFIVGFYTVAERLYKRVIYLWVPGENEDGELHLPGSRDILPTRQGVYDLCAGAYGRATVSFTWRATRKREVLYSAPGPVPGLSMRLTAHPFGPSSSFILRRFDEKRGHFGLVMEREEGGVAETNGIITVDRSVGSFVFGYGGYDYNLVKIGRTALCATYPGGFCETREDNRRVLVSYSSNHNLQSQLPYHIDIVASGRIETYVKGTRVKQERILPPMTNFEVETLD